MVNHYLPLGAAKLEKVIEESSVNEQGNFTINTLVLDAFTLYSAQKLEKMEGITGPLCEMTGCTRNVTLGYAKSQSKPGSRLCDQHNLSGMVREYACTE